MRIIFMGTPEFAVPSLDILVKHGYDIVGVITAVDKPAGRGNKLRQSAVKKYALEHGLPVLQPPRLKRKAFLKQLKALNADLQVVVAFRMLPAAVFEMPPNGTINLHAALLPQYRGAAPINWAVINGETETGATTFFIEQQIDTGNMIFQCTTPIAPHENAGDVHDRLMYLGAELVLKTVQAIAANDYPQIPQPTLQDLKPAPKIYKETCTINWQDTTLNIYNKIRGLSPYPAAFTHVNGKVFKIYACEKQVVAHHYTAGTIIANKKQLQIATLDGFIIPTHVQIQGRKRMPADAFLRGFKGVLAITT